MNPNAKNIPPMKVRRRALRNNPTVAEIVLWKRLQRRQILGKKFRRQFSIGSYIVDFFCTELNIAVELDGAIHGDPIRAEYDAERAAYLEKEGVHVLRFENKWVFENMEGVLETIRAAMGERKIL
jgi:very-short-patch-repair endonuclease